MQHRHIRMTFDDAKEYLHIAENAFNAGAYQESAQIVTRLAYFAADDSNGLTCSERRELTDGVKRAIGRFTECPDECTWEDMCGLEDLFR